eukprot:Filipodium_phascolosomae@DN3327_c0_g1_i1.p1
MFQAGWLLSNFRTLNRVPFSCFFSGQPGSLKATTHRCTFEPFSAGPFGGQIRNFGGRRGGRRRKKDIHWTVYQAFPHLGKRFEPRWYPRQRQTRIPFYQNIRDHVIFNAPNKRWMTFHYFKGVQQFKVYRSLSFEENRTRALKRRSHLWNSSYKYDR